jgi:hypothetical protein
MPADDVQPNLDDLTEEKNRLDLMLDDALEKFAEYEEGMNVRWHTSSPEEITALMAERSQVEETLGIVAIVERLDVLREQIEAVLAGRVA